MKDTDPKLFLTSVQPALTISAHNGREIVRITPEGKVIINPEFTIDEAAREFWEAVRKLAAREA